MYNNSHSHIQDKPTNTFDPRPPASQATRCDLAPKASPYRSSTCQYTTTGSYTCAPSQEDSHISSCDSFYSDKYCNNRSEKEHPQKRFERLMGKE